MYIQRASTTLLGDRLNILWQVTNIVTGKIPDLIEWTCGNGCCLFFWLVKYAVRDVKCIVHSPALRTHANCDHLIIVVLRHLKLLVLSEKDIRLTNQSQWFSYLFLELHQQDVSEITYFLEIHYMGLLILDENCLTQELLWSCTCLRSLPKGLLSKKQH